MGLTVQHRRMIFILNVLSYFHIINGDCRFGNYNFERLGSHTWETRNQKSNISYSISLCNALPGINQPCNNNAAVCSHSFNTQTWSLLGNWTKNLHEKITSDKGVLNLTLKGAPCTKVEHEYKKAVILFKCGRTLGAPVFLDEFACDTYFEWFTSVACDRGDDSPLPPAEVPCSVYDTQGRKRDLSPLIKNKGAYYVGSTDEDSTFYINVCRDITPDKLVSAGCGGAAACRLADNTPQHVGSPTRALAVNEDGSPYLEYTSEDTPEGCASKSVTTVVFRCPARGMSRDPVLEAAADCRYSVLWETEYACAEDTLTSNTCKLSSGTHGVEIDLTPLINTDPEHKYKATSANSDGSVTYDYYLNVCEEVGVECPNDAHKAGVTSCQLSEADATFGKVLGKKDHQQLRYSDRELTLTYADGDICHDKFKRTTVIQFHCNETAINSGKGEPIFNSEDNCVYLFDWDTKYACVDLEASVTCQVTSGKQEFDLSTLRKASGSSNWESLNAKDDQSKERFYINVCGNVLSTNDTTQCPDTSAACYKAADGAFKNIGRFKSSPTYDAQTKSLQLRFTEGDACDNGKKQMQTLIRFSCKPGDLESGPVLTSKSSDECVYEFEWHTAGACVLSRATGQKCKVFNEELGYSFDLSPLTKAGSQAYYLVTSSTTDHNYYINVCAAVSDKDGACASDAGGCQERQSDVSNKHNTGQPNGELHYYNGLINLVYHNGDPYQTSPPIPRQTEIAFLCDPAAGDAGVGQPAFLTETNHTYSFRWFTKYACPQAPIECAFIDETTNNQYDLSSLTKGEGGGNWESVDSANKKQYYINVCRPLNPTPEVTGCDTKAGVCGTQIINEHQTRVFAGSLGEAAAPRLDAGRVLLEYTHGGNCTRDDGSHAAYETRIHLQCKRGEAGRNTHPIPVGVADCVYSFTWDTEAGCPVTHGEASTEEDCRVKDPASDFVFNLQHLRKSGQGPSGYYNVTAPNASKPYKLNVCGAVADCTGTGTSVCLGGNQLGKVNKQLEISNAGVISLTYTGNRTSQGDLEKAVVIFDCDEKAYDGRLLFDRKDGDTHRFVMKTSAACPPKPVQCQVTDAEGNEYDLSSLAKLYGSWEVPDTRTSYGHLRYYINVCRPITATNATKSCPGGPIGGCQLDTRSAGSAHSMGYVQGQPYAAEGALTLRYTGGEVCHAGKPEQSYRSTRINFFCAHTESEPVMVSESPSCEYLIDWRTPAACPLQTVVGENCQVTEKLYGHKFDLSGIARVGTNYVSNTGEYQFLLNVCSAVSTEQGGCKDGVGSCQTKDSDSQFTAVNAGNANDKLIYEDGVIMLNYTGGKRCHQDKYERSTVIRFTCDHKVMSGAPLNYTESDDCTYNFEWPTSLACMPVTIGECDLVKADGTVIDLSPLTRSNDNYLVKGTKPNEDFRLNMCTTLVHKPGTTCPIGSAACLIDSTDPKKKKFISIGSITGEHQISEENQHVTVTYDNGDECPTDNTKKLQTVMQLTCPEEADAGLDTEPTFMYISECVYHFMWKTKAACPKSGPQTGANCTVTDPTTGVVYNLANLRTADGVKVDDGNGRFYEINVCGKLEKTTCLGNNIGSCQVENGGAERHFAAGLANSDLQYVSNGVLQLNYTGGKLCQHNKQNRSTVISFVCSQDEDTLPVMLGESDDCTYYITWPTKLACQTEVACSVERGGQKYDLSPLVEGYHTAQITDALDKNILQGSYYVSVCRPLPPVQGRLCPPEAAVCRENNSTHTSSLGQAVSSPFIDVKTHQVTIRYEHGDTCRGEQKWNSRIEFKCKVGNNKGTPVLMAVENCEYVFEWETYLVCDGSAPEVNSDCKYTDTRTKNTYDFNSLSGHGDYQVPGKTGVNYYVNPCASLTDTTAECKGAATCRVKETQHTAFGAVKPVTFVPEGDDFKMVQTAGNCPAGEKRQSVIIFHCTRSLNENGAPELFSESECTVVFKWETPLACLPDVKPCIFSQDGATYDLTRLSMENNHWEMKDNDGNTYYLNLCESVHKAPPGCPSNAAVCRKTSDGKMEMLGTVDSQEIQLTDGNLIVKYSQGTMACSKRRRRSENASVKITLVCGKGVNGPHVTQTDTTGDNCLFEFLWTTNLACKEQRLHVTPDDNLITDPMSGLSLDITKLFVDEQFAVQTADYKYLMNLGGSISEQQCTGTAAVCQTSISQKNDKISIADRETRILYLEEGTIEAVYTSQQMCTPNSSAKKSVTTIVDIRCSQEPGRSPAFFYKSKSCHYIFEWETPTACFYKYGNGEVPSASVQTSSSTTIGVVVGVFLSIALLSVLVIVLYKKERRDACFSRTRRLFGRRRPGYTYSYSQLTTEEATLDTLLTESSNSSGRYGSDVTDTSNFQLLNDDSDDDDVLLGL